MPRLSTWLIRMSLGYLVLGFTLGGLMLAQKGGFGHPAVWIVRPAHQEMLLFGFMLQLVFGVGFWILPRAASPGSTRPMTAALILINAGVLAFTTASLIPGASRLAALGRLFECAAVVLFAIHIWPRVRSFRKAEE